METRPQRRHRAHAATSRKLLALVGIASALPLVFASASAGAAPSAGPNATPPSNCRSSFDPYAYTQSAVGACGYQTFSRTAVKALPGGGSSYDYSVKGSTVRFYVPPAGFVPATATDAQLDEYGLPARPTNPTALSRWQREMSNWKGAASPPPFLAESQAQADSVTSPNWSGYAVSGSSGTFTHAEAWYVEPTFYSSVCSTNAEVTWAGLGGYGNTALGQDGTTHNVPGLGNHQAWWEVWPDVNIIGVNFYGHPGYLFDASTRRISGGYRFYMYDYYSARTDAFDVSINDYSGNSAEAIAERPKINGSFSNLSNFKTMTFGSSEANGNGIDTYSGSGPRHGVHMVASNGDDLADPSGIGGDGSFTDTQHHCS